MTKNDELFLQLIAIFQSSAMQGMGKIQNPVTEKTEVNEAQAKHAIETLDMLKEKTHSNLSDALNRTLKLVISDLKLNFSNLNK